LHKQALWYTATVQVTEGVVQLLASGRIVQHDQSKAKEQAVVQRFSSCIQVIQELQQRSESGPVYVAHNSYSVGVCS